MGTLEFTDIQDLNIMGIVVNIVINGSYPLNQTVYTQIRLLLRSSLIRVYTALRLFVTLNEIYNIPNENLVIVIIIKIW